MWTPLAHNVIKYRLILIIILGLITTFMGYHARKVAWSYDFSKVVPADDPEMKYYQQFRSLFGEDGNIIAIGIADSSIYSIENFSRYHYLNDALAGIHGIKDVISLPNLQKLEKDTEKKQFHLQPVFSYPIENQHTLDSMVLFAKDQKFYSGQLINESEGALLMLVFLNEKALNSSQRDVLVEDILHLGNAFTETTGIKLHYAGLPFVRSVTTRQVSSELQMFLFLSIAVTALVLLLFFRSWDAVVFPMIIIMVVVIWSLGTISLLGYKINILTALIPPIIVVIGIPNSIYLLNKYHYEFDRHGNKMKALSRMIRRIGLVALITNFTTAVSFLVLAFTDIVVLKEFGIVAGINILATFLVSIILIPAVFSYLPSPGRKQLKHLKFKLLEKSLTALDLLVHKKKYVVFGITGVIVIISVIGLSKIETVSYVVDDIPESSQIRKDLAFFEKNFSGVMPLELIVDTGKKRGVTRLENLKKIDALERFLAEQEHISQPISMVSFVKAGRQAFYNNNPRFYALPNNQDKAFILRYLSNQEDSAGLLTSFVDSTGQKMRVSFKIADIGSNKMEALLREVIRPKISEIVQGSPLEVIVTGSTLLFIKGNQFLVENLRTSLLLAFVIIAMIMGILFRNVKMIFISILPNIIPLIITAGVMGFFGIPLKPSTALIFCIVFGISVDDSIHFLAKYRQELFSNNFFVPIAVSKSIQEIGPSMMYTSIILFAGFVIFSASDFGGTIALGVLSSTTLLIAMITNLVVLPSLLLTFDDGKRKKDTHPPIEHYDEFYQEDDDEEIDLSLIDIEKE